jgi:hypothetical protein
MRLPKLFTHHPFFIRLLHWEYWSFTAVYGWIYPIFALLCLRAGGRFFFTAANPTIKHGGFLMEPKQDIYPLIPEQYYPAFFFVPAGTSINYIKQQIDKHQFQFPLIAKPVIGMQGKAVKKVNSFDELVQYAAVCTVDFMVQQLSPYQHEVGVFYYRMPDAAAGTVTGIVAKEPMTVVGDGVSTLYQLILEEPRYILQIDALKQMFGKDILQVLPEGESLILAPYGNHARGSKFVDWSHKADAVFIESIDAVCRQIKGFHYGRLDVMYNDWDDLRQGKNFHIIELNGAGSDPTHMYDPKHSLFYAWREITRHWFILYRISKQNHAKGHSYMSIKEAREMFRTNNLHVAALDAIAPKL